MTAPAAVVLLSGGVDSATVAALALADGFDVCALSFRYGQRHAAELDAAERVARALGIERRLVLDIDLRPIGGSALTADLPVPRDRPTAEMGTDIPATYVPARNTIFLSLALAWAEVLGAQDIFIGANALDYSGYPDCRPEYLRAFETLANLATRAGVEGRHFTIHAPLLHLTKAGIVRRGTELGVNYALTVSCYAPAPDGAACGRCDACRLRRKGFEEGGIPDPTRYRA
jgi:7-cyano-7-deazaguanine synthase